jgi:hypothetical protein
MNKRNASGGPNPAVLLLIPAALIIAKGMRHRRAMWESGWTPSGAAGHGHHRRFGGDGEAAASSFRLPPKIEWMLDTWHTRAHQKADPTDSTAPKTQEGSETI